MSVINGATCRNMSAAVYYCRTNGGADGERVAAYYCDLPRRAYLDLARQHGRMIQGYTLIQSWPKDELSVNNPDDVARANEIGRKLAHKLYPDCPSMVITHTDSKSGCLHNHILVINHNMESGGCIRTNRLHRDITRINDDLMREEGLSTPKPRAGPKMSQGEYHSNRRNGWLDAMAAGVRRALEAAVDMDDFATRLRVEGMVPDLFDAKGRPKKSMGVRMTDQDGREHKKRIARLGDDLSMEQITETLRRNAEAAERQRIMPMDEWIRMQQEAAAAAAEPEKAEEPTPIEPEQAPEPEQPETAPETEQGCVPFAGMDDRLRCLIDAYRADDLPAIKKYAAELTEKERQLVMARIEGIEAEQEQADAVAQYDGMGL